MDLLLTNMKPLSLNGNIRLKNFSDLFYSCAQFFYKRIIVQAEEMSYVLPQATKMFPKFIYIKTSCIEQLILLFYLLSNIFIQV
jgi:hypothetical protein